MKYLRYAFLAVILLFCVTVAFANREMVTLALWPETVTAFVGLNPSVTAPLFIIVGLAAGLGLVCGLIWEWLRERSLRAEAKRNKRELDRIRAEPAHAPAMPATRSEPRDRVLAILDDKEA